jgi:hypothetical protein
MASLEKGSHLGMEFIGTVVLPAVARAIKKENGEWRLRNTEKSGYPRWRLRTKTIWKVNE